ncbi:MAG TPA: hypothetical protein VNC15_06035 [Solirubrobacterales bacterium]|nr:hypothetical protein [Solirubrobacterales bacterium]
MDSAGAIRVHNTGAFAMFFYVKGGGQTTPDSGGNYGVGQSATINVNPPIPAGAEMWPVADILAGPNSHEASENVICDPTSTMTAVYDCGGSAPNPSFIYKGLSSD